MKKDRVPKHSSTQMRTEKPNNPRRKRKKHSARGHRKTNHGGITKLIVSSITLIILLAFTPCLPDQVNDLMTNIVELAHEIQNENHQREQIDTPTVSSWLKTNLNRLAAKLVVSILESLIGLLQKRLHRPASPRGTTNKRSSRRDRKRR